MNNFIQIGEGHCWICHKTYYQNHICTLETVFATPCNPLTCGRWYQEREKMENNLSINHMSEQQNKKECKCEEDHNGNCYFCGRNMLVSPLTMEERSPRQFGKNSIRLTRFFIEGKKGKAVIFATPEGNFLSPKAVEQAVSQALKEQVKEILKLGQVHGGTRDEIWYESILMYAKSKGLLSNNK